MNVRIIILALFTLTVLSACAPDPRKEAQANQINEQAQQDALNQEQQRKQSEDIHAFKMQQNQREQERWEATKTQIFASLKIGIQIVSWFAIACACVIVVYATLSIKTTMQGIAIATVQKAEISANLIHLDANGQFPALIQRMGGGKWSLTDLNTRTTMLLDVRNDPDAQLVAGAIAVRHDVALAHEARLSKDSGESIVTITPPIIHKIIDVQQDVTNE